MLSHLRVLDLTDNQAAICGYLLAQHGAEVIRVEPPGGSPLRRLGPWLPDGSSAVAAAFGRGTRSITLELHDVAVLSRSERRRGACVTEGPGARGRAFAC